MMGNPTDFVRSREIADAIRGRALQRWREGRGRAGRPPTVNLSAEQREQLRALGYVNP